MAANVVNELFHPLTARWFESRFEATTDAQEAGWPAIAAGRNTLIAAPTGSGKTLAAFLSCIDQLLQKSLAGTLEDKTFVLYISPLKALSNDIHRNLDEPLSQLLSLVKAERPDATQIRALVRTGDSTSAQRLAILKRPPHILVTTPESFYLLLTSQKGRTVLSSIETVIIDEIHALARDKRGSHLTLSLERLDRLCVKPPIRIGLSATQRPMELVAKFLVGTHQLDAAGNADCQIVDIGHSRALDLGVITPPMPLGAVCSHEQWGEIYEQLVDLIQTHRSTLVFVNTRRLAERVSFQLSELLGKEFVASHHGSLSKEIRLAAEENLKTGKLKVIVATASLELGIDIGFIDLVCQIGSPRAIATFLQRVGRSGHAIGATPKGRVFALTRDDLIETISLIRAVKARRLDKIIMPTLPLDILSQQIAAAVACEDWNEDELFTLCKGAWPFADLPRTEFDAVVEMLSDPVKGGSRRGIRLHRDRINGTLRAPRGARMVALTNGGAIPDLADYRVVTADEGTFVGTVNEDFAIESIAGDIFQLGNMSWQVQRVTSNGEVLVRDADGAPATIPFWLGEAPGRTRELSDEVSNFLQEISPIVERVLQETPDANLTQPTGPDDSAPALDPIVQWLWQNCGVNGWPARQAAQYVVTQQAAIGLLPTQRRVVFERFFDESGGMQLVVHAPFGTRINRAWGLAFRKRFCRSFNFELQASADDNGVVLSLGPQHSFAIDHLFTMMKSEQGQYLLEQALLAAPMFKVRWRWNATRALMVPRFRNGKKVPPPLQRFNSEDFLSNVFPLTTGCLENHSGDIPIPDHPLIRQTVGDCMTEAMDLESWLNVLRSIESGEIELVARDTREPSPFSHERLNANAYAFLDDAPLEERRARAVSLRRTLNVGDYRDLGRLDVDAISQVRSEAAIEPRSADELHDALLLLCALPEAESQAWEKSFEELVRRGQAARVFRADQPTLWISAERVPAIKALFADAQIKPEIRLPELLSQPVSDMEAAVMVTNGWLEVSGPITARELSTRLGANLILIQAALETLEAQGSIMRGDFTSGSSVALESSNGRVADRETEWCDRRLLARIHRLTLDGARKQIRPVEPNVFLRFLLEHQHLLPSAQLDGTQGLKAIIGQLEGFESPAGAWEQDIFARRTIDYDPGWLDELSLTGEVIWGRLQPPKKDESSAMGGTMSRIVPLSIVQRKDLAWLLPADRVSVQDYTRGNAQQAYEALQEHGALFFDDLADYTGLLPTQLQDALGELSALGLVSSDGFTPLRALVTKKSTDSPFRRRQRRMVTQGVSRGGRWSKFPPPINKQAAENRVQHWAMLLLRRYGVMFRDLLTREDAAPPWYELAQVYRRMESRGEIRGGRFVAKVGGEQYGLPEVVDQIRKVRDTPLKGEFIKLSAADPLNLSGIITGGPRVAALRSNALMLKDGELIASREGGKIQFHKTLPQPDRLFVLRALDTAGRKKFAIEEVAPFEPAIPHRVGIRGNETN